MRWGIGLAVSLALAWLLRDQWFWPMRLRMLRGILRGDSVMYRMRVTPEGVSPKTGRATIVENDFMGQQTAIRLERL